MKPAVATGRLQALLDQRTELNESFFGTEAERLARVCHQMAERFARDGRLIAIGSAPAARTDVRHIAVEFVHPVIVGKRALPAIGLVGDAAELRRQLEPLARPDDIIVTFDADALADVRSRGCLTLGFERGLGAEHEFEPPGRDPFIRQELVETLYHVLWELVHVFFDHRGLLSGRSARTVHDAGASSFLYPFLDERESELEPVIEDVRRSVLMKSAEVGELRAQTLRDNAEVLGGAAAALLSCFESGGKVLSLGNGGSATDAMDVVADLRAGARAAIDLCEDPSILTAIANDIGVDAIFSRQVIAYGLPGDVLLALSTSGNSANVIAALAEARRRGLVSVAFVGYDGGRVAAEELADYAIVTHSEHIPRIQEAQASAYHALCELIS